MRKPRFTSGFNRDRKLLKRRGWSTTKLDTLIRHLIAEAPLPISCGAHSLHGKWDGCMDCHVEGDWVLIYELHDTACPKEVTFHRTGTHSDLF